MLSGGKTGLVSAELLRREQQELRRQAGGSKNLEGKLCGRHHAVLDWWLCVWFACGNGGSEAKDVCCQRSSGEGIGRNGMRTQCHRSKPIPKGSDGFSV